MCALNDKLLAMTDSYDPYQEMVKEKSPELFCDNCGHYPKLALDDISSAAYEFSEFITDFSDVSIPKGMLPPHKIAYKNLINPSSIKRISPRAIFPMHGHFVCPACFMPTKCCEGAPADV